MKKPAKKPAAKKAPAKKMSGGGVKPRKLQKGSKGKNPGTSTLTEVITKRGLGSKNTPAFVSQSIADKDTSNERVLYTRATPASQVPGKGAAQMYNYDKLLDKLRQSEYERGKKGLPLDAPEQEALAQQELVRQRKNYIAKQQAAATVKDIKSGKVDYKKYLPKKKKGGTSKMRKK